MQHVQPLRAIVFFLTPCQYRVVDDSCLLESGGVAHANARMRSVQLVARMLSRAGSHAVLLSEGSCSVHLCEMSVL